MVTLKDVLVVGATTQGLQAALGLAHLGREVVVADNRIELGDPPRHFNEKGRRRHQYLLTECRYHPLVEILTETNVEEIRDEEEKIWIQLSRKPRWILPGLCVDCGKCLDACPVETQDGRKPLFHVTAPSTMAIDKRKEAPCRSACPIDMNPQGYVALIVEGRFEEAYELIRDKNPLPGICGRICHHPCEKECRRQEIDEPVAICALKRFASDEALKHRNRGKSPVTLVSDGPRVAIVGSGPAGLTAAYDLARAGFRPTLVEAEEKPGGLLRQAIAPFRLPRNILEEEVTQILAAGVELRLKKPVRSLEELQSLKAEGFEAVLLALGASKDRPLNILGEDLDGIYGCVSFLNGLWNGEFPRPLSRVVVIGGGNAAIESARAAVRTEAEEVVLVCLEQRDEMPAWGHEIEEALAEGVSIVNGLGPVRFLGKDGRLSLIEFKRCTAVFDQTGRFNPQYDETHLETLQANTVIVAIGQVPNAIYGLSIQTDGKARVPWVYTSGDMVSGPSTVVDAMASGRKAARAIIQALRAEREEPEDHSPVTRDDYDPIPEGLPKRPRTTLPRRKANERIKDTNEVTGPLSMEEAIKEASRCLQCGVCSECLRCQVSCELEAIRHDGVATQRSLCVERLIVADPGQMAFEAPSLRVINTARHGKRESWTNTVLAGQAAAVDALSKTPLMVPQVRLRFLPLAGNREKRVGVFVCSCNGTLNDDGRLDQILPSVTRLPGVVHTQVLISACHPEKGLVIEEMISQKALNGAVIASCACCHLDFACESCNDQRIRLKDRLFRRDGFDPTDIALVNIKETCLVPFRNEPSAATELALKVIGSGLLQLQHSRRPLPENGKPLLSAIVLGATEEGLAAAKGLRAMLRSVVVSDHRNVTPEITQELRRAQIELIHPVRPVRLEGQRGDFTLVVDAEGDPGGIRDIKAGMIILGRNEYRDIPYQKNPFLKDHHSAIRRAFGTLETSIPGVYLASWSQARKTPPDTSGKAAALGALEAAIQPTKSFDQSVAQVNAELCRGCGRCADICPEGAARLQETFRGVASSWVVPGLCTGCGACLATCPTGAIGMPETEQEYFEEVMDVLLG